MSDEQLEYSAKLLADNISLEKRNKEIYEGFMATTQELCEATKEIEKLNSLWKTDKQSWNELMAEKETEIERLNNIINELEKTLLEWHKYWEDNDDYNWEYKTVYDYIQELKGVDKE